MVKNLESALGANLKSAILFGSAAAGDHMGAGSDFNLLIIIERLSVEDLKRVMPHTNKWIRSGNPPPLFFTWERLRRSCDVFPIEILDIVDARRVLSGEDLVATLQVSGENLRLQLEHELKGKLIQLREGFLETKGRSSRIVRLLVESLSSFLVLARASLRLLGDSTPPCKMDAMRLLGERFLFDVEPFETVAKIKEGSLKGRQVDAEGLFSQYHTAAEQFVDSVDLYILPQQ
jgi:predicted nucleotidyltransferase